MAKKVEIKRRNDVDIEEKIKKAGIEVKDGKIKKSNVKKTKKDYSY